jgi:hypothetical protein
MTMTADQYQECNRIKGRITEELAGVNDLPLLSEMLSIAKKQKGRAIGHLLRAKKEAQQTQQASQPSDPDPSEDDIEPWMI